MKAGSTADEAGSKVGAKTGGAGSEAGVEHRRGCVEDWAGLKTGEGWVKDVGELRDGWDSEAVDVLFTSMLKKSAVDGMAAVVG